MRITRHAHPLRGREFAVLKDGNAVLVIRLGDDTSMRIPRAWTDADGDGVGSGPEPTVFTTESLEQVLRLVEAVGQRG